MEVILFLLGVFCYFIPTILAIHKKSILGVFLLNLLLGWTFIGWCVALLWAVLDQNQE